MSRLYRKHRTRVWVYGSLLLGLLVTAGFGACMIWMPGRSFEGALPPMTAEQRAVSERLKRHVYTLAETIGERNVWTTGYKALKASEEYIRKEFSSSGYAVADQVFQVHHKDVRNLEGTLKGGGLAAEIVVIGAHYDAVSDCPAANDNGSGVAAMLEVARLMKDAKPARTIRFVAFVNEEPPFFQTESMGSLVYARACRARNENIVAMLSLETIGYYSDAPDSQQYPRPFSYFYPSTGNFIAFVGDLGSRELVRRAVRTFREEAQFPSEGAAPPRSISGVGWSDHWAFWQVDYPAIMLTDTAPFRYPQYHTADDTPEKLDYDKMARVTTGVVDVVAELAE